MERDCYFCTHCSKMEGFVSDSVEPRLRTCPKCHRIMEYDFTDIYDETGKYLGSKKKEQPKSNVDMKYIMTGVPTVECPYCHSTNTEKISGFSRGFMAGLLGLGASQVGKQWHCNRCKSDF